MQTRAQSRCRAASEAELALLLERVATELPTLALVLVLRPLPAVELARLACVNKAYWLVLVQLREEHPGRRYAKPLATDHYRHVPRLLRAAGYGDVAVLGSMIEAGVDERGVSLQHNAREVISLALNFAADSGYLHVVELLIRAGANVHYDGRIIYGRDAVVQLLIQLGANVHAGNYEAIRFASENGHTDVVQLLLEHGAIMPAPEIIGQTRHQMQRPMWKPHLSARSQFVSLRHAHSLSVICL
jgi:hypothetical protein